MPQTKPKEILILNLILLLIAVGLVAVAAHEVLTQGLRTGIDGLFIVLTFLALALVLLAPVAWWAHENGMIKNPFKRRAAARDQQA